MKKQFLYLSFLALLLSGWVISGASAQAEDELRLRMRKNFGYNAGSTIQGLFTLTTAGPADINRVVFYLDNQVIGEATAAPFSYQFSTGNYPLGAHNLYAIGYTASGRELRSNDITARFVTAQQGLESGMKFAMPLLVIVFGILLLSVAALFVGGRKRQPVEPGEPRNYGIWGGTICPRCERPFVFRLASMNLGPGLKLERCPHCGRVGVFRRRSIEDLRQAEANELEKARQAGHAPSIEDEDSMRKELDNSRYQDM